MTSVLRGRGLTQKQTVLLIGCLCGTVTRGRGSKHPKILRTLYVNGPHMAAPCPFWLPALWHVINMTFCQHILSAPLARLGSKAVVIKLRICRIQHLFMLKVLLPNGPQSPPNIIMYRVLRNLQRQHSVLYCILRLEREKGKIASHPDSQLDLQNCA